MRKPAFALLLFAGAFTATPIRRMADHPSLRSLRSEKGDAVFAPQFEVIQRIASEQNIFLVPADFANSSGHTGLFRVIENLPNLLIRSRALPVFGTPHCCNTLKLLKRVR